MWIVIGGVVGARLYHVATDWEKFEGDWLRVLEIWHGGLSIWGVIVGGAIAVFVVAPREAPRRAAACATRSSRASCVAQAIGRWGNWFNQELFGEPTTLPWGLEIDPAHRPPGFAEATTFHPTFLYESLYCLALAAVLLWVERRWRLRTRTAARAVPERLLRSGGSGSRTCASTRRSSSARCRVNAWVSLLRPDRWRRPWFFWLAPPRPRRSRPVPGRGVAGAIHRGGTSVV